MDLQAVDSALSQIAGRSRRSQDNAEAAQRFADELSGALAARRQDLDTRPPRPSIPRTRPEDDIADRRPAPRRPDSDAAKAERAAEARGETVSRKERRRDRAEAAEEPPEAKPAPAEQEAAPVKETDAAVVEATAPDPATAVAPTEPPTAPAAAPAVPISVLQSAVQPKSGTEAEATADAPVPAVAAPAAGDIAPEKPAAPPPAAADASDASADALAAQTAAAAAAEAPIAASAAKVSSPAEGAAPPAAENSADATPPATTAAQAQLQTQAQAAQAQAAAPAPAPADPAPAASPTAATAATGTTVAAAAAVPAARDTAPQVKETPADEVVAVDRPVRDTSRRETLDPAAILAVTTAASDGAGTDIPAGQVTAGATLLRAAATTAAPIGAFAAAVQEAGFDDAKPAGIAEAKEIAGAPFGQAGIDRRAGVDPAVRAEPPQPARQNLPVPPVADQIAVRMAKQAQTGEGRITLQLNPEVLGAVDVDLEVRKDGSMTAVISVEKPETLEWLKRDAQHLERALQDVGVKTDSGSLSFALREQRQEGSGGFGGRGTRRGPAMTEGADAVGGRRGEAMTADIAARRMARGGVDVKI